MEGDLTSQALSLHVHPLTTDRWDDLLALFGKSGAYSGCWCMWWRESSADFSRLGNAGNREAFKALLDGGSVPGLLAYLDDRPVGWVSVGPREEFVRLERSPTLKRVDEQPVWSIVCFFIARGYRRQGVGRALLQAAVDYAAQHGARMVEGYPVEPGERKLQDAYVFTGLAGMFEREGFREVARRSKGRPIVRREVGQSS